MEITLNDEIVDAAMARLAERFTDPNLEDTLFNIQREALDFAWQELETDFDELLGNPERMALTGGLALRWMAVQILTYRELLAGEAGDVTSDQ